MGFLQGRAFALVAGAEELEGMQACGVGQRVFAVLAGGESGGGGGVAGEGAWLALPKGRTREDWLCTRSLCE